MNATYIANLSWTDFAEISKNNHTVIIPVGAVECYGPHLPMSSDTIVAEAVAKLISEKTGAVIAPSIPVGESASLSMFPGTLWVRAESFKEYTRDIISSLRVWGFKYILFINGHAGNVPMITQLAMELQLENKDLQISQIDWWRYVQSVGDDILENKGYMAHGHASECGTSILMYVAPNLVHFDRLICEQPKIVNGKRFPGVLRTTPFKEFSDNGMIGDARTASVEKGEILVTRCVEKIVKYMEEDFI